MQLHTPAAPAAHAPRPFYRHLYFQVLCAIFAGALGLVFQPGPKPDAGAGGKPSDKTRDAGRRTR